MTRQLLVVVVAAAVLAAVQVSLVSPLRLGGVVVMVVWLWPLALGLTASPGAAVLSGLLAGGLFDARAATPFGCAAVVGALLGWGVALLAREGIGDLDGAAWWVPVVLIGLGGTLAPALFVAAGAATGHLALWRSSLLGSMAVNGAVFVVLAQPAARAARAVATLGGFARS